MIEIGALVRHAQAERSPELCARQRPSSLWPCSHIGHPAIRNRGTIGGSVAFADPAAELPACVLALGGESTIAGPQGSPHRQRRRCSSRACSRPRLPPVTCLPPSASSPPARDTRVGFAEFARRHGDYAMVGLGRLRAGRRPSASRSRAWPISAWPPRRSAHIMRSTALTERRYRRGGACARAAISNRR